MSSSAFCEAVTAYDAVDVALDKANALDVDALSHSEPMQLLERRQTWRRRLDAGDHELINELAHGSVEELGDKLAYVLADRLRIYRRDAARRIEEAADLGSRSALTGEPLSPRLEHTAAGQREGRIGADHVKVIREFFARLPGFVDEPTREDAERQLAEVASQFRPDELKRFAAQLDLMLNPDGNFSDEDRACRRGITVGPQGPDGMSKLSGYLTPEARAGWDAVQAKWAAPGMCNPADETPTVSSTPSQEAIRCDARSTAQRNHDAFNAIIRSALTSGELGAHNGLPVTIIATATLEDLQAKTGVAHAGGGTVLPMSDVIRMAAHSYHYLLLFDKANRCELYKGRDSRLATPAQRIVLHATDRGCSHPGCTVPGYGCQVHHAAKDWTAGGLTNIDELTFACGPHNRLVEEDGWRTRKRKDGTTEWIPPPHLDTGKPRTNGYHHPERYLRRENDDDEDEFDN
jgi:hypothetical protein